jgi:hypothetical protein
MMSGDQLPPDVGALEETLDVLSAPRALADIWRAEEEIARGETIGVAELDDIARAVPPGMAAPIRSPRGRGADRGRG